MGKKPPEIETAEQLVGQANSHQRQNDFDKAIALYTKALDHDMDNDLRSAIFFNRSVALAKTQRWEESLQDANECARINPSWMRGAECQGTALEGLGRLHEALAAFETAQQLDPNNESIARTMRDIRARIQQGASSPTQPATVIAEPISDVNKSSIPPIPEPQEDGSNTSLVQIMDLLPQSAAPDRHVPLPQSTARSPEGLPQGSSMPPIIDFPKLIKQSSESSMQQNYVQSWSEGQRRFVKWAVKGYNLNSGETSLRTVFPNFPQLLDVLGKKGGLEMEHIVLLENIQSNASHPTVPTFKIPPPSECQSKMTMVVVIDRCEGLTILMDGIKEEILMINCHNLTLVVGHHPPTSGINLVQCRNCKIVISERVWKDASVLPDVDGLLRCTASSGIFFVLVSEPSGREHMGLSSFELEMMRHGSQGVDRVVLPDSLTTRLANRTIVTRCSFNTKEKEEQAVKVSSPAKLLPSPVSQSIQPTYVESRDPVAIEPTNIIRQDVSNIRGPTEFLGSGVLHFRMKLDLDEDAIFEKGSQHRLTFENMLAHDLANCTGLPAQNFRTTSMFGSLIAEVEVSLKVQEGVHFNGIRLAMILENQECDPASKLHSGSVTKHIQGIAFPFDLRPGVCGFKVKLGLDFSHAGIQGSVERLSFQNQFIFDLCNASGLQESRFRVKNTSPGSIIVETEIHTGSEGSQLARSVLANLDQQAMDPNSLLRFGQLTRFISCASPDTSKLLHPSDPPRAIPHSSSHTALPLTQSQPSPGQSLSAPPLSPEAASVNNFRPLDKPVSENRSGIGIAVGKDGTKFYVADILPASPAFAAGIRKGDILETIDDYPLANLKLTEVVKLLRGPAGSTSTVVVGREPFGGAPSVIQTLLRFAFTVTRPLTDGEQISTVTLPESALTRITPSPSPLLSMGMPSVPMNNQIPSIPKNSKMSISPGPSDKQIGVGLGIAKDGNGFIKVCDILEGSISEREGSIQKHDIIEKVDGTSIRGMQPNDVVAMLRGPENSHVTLDIRRNSWAPSDRSLDVRLSVVLPRKTSTLQLSPSQIQASLMLDMNMWQVTDHELFKREVAYDVYIALVGSVKSVTAVGVRAGSVIVDLQLIPQGEKTGVQIVNDLSNQARDLSSPLMQGKHTQRTIKVSLGHMESNLRSLETSGSAPPGLAPRTLRIGTLGMGSTFKSNKIVSEVDKDIKIPRTGTPPVLFVPPPDPCLRTHLKEPARAGLGLGLTAGKGLVYTVSGLTPGGAAEASGQIQCGDVVHSIDGTLITGKTIEEIQSLFAGDAGTKVMIAVLRSDAMPDDLELELHHFERWRPVVLIRSPIRQSQQDAKPAPARNATNDISRKSIWPLRDGKEVIAVDLLLDEDYKVVAPTIDDKVSFATQLSHDISKALQVVPTQVSVVDLLPGSVIAVIEFLSVGHQEMTRDPEELAMELMRQVSRPDSLLRETVTCRRAKHARARLAENPMSSASQSLYPNSSTLSAADIDDSMSKMEGGGQWLSLGLVLRKDASDRFCTVQYLRPGGPAEQSGCIFPGNQIVSVDGRSMDGVPMTSVVRQMGEGEWGTQVNVGILRLKGSRGALRDQNVSTVVTLRRGLKPTQFPAVSQSPLASVNERSMLSTSDFSNNTFHKGEDFPFQYTGPCRVAVLQRKLDHARDAVGIGIILQQLEPSGQVMVLAVPEGGTAAESGQVFIGDIIHQIDNVPTSGKSINQVMRMMEGPVDTPIVLMLQSTTRRKQRVQAADVSRVLPENLYDDSWQQEEEDLHIQDIPETDGKLDPHTYPMMSEGKPTLSPFDYKESSPAKPVRPDEKGTQASRVDEKLGSKFGLTVLTAFELGLQSEGTLECQLRLLHPARNPWELGKANGQYDASSKTAVFKSRTLECLVFAREMERAQIECSLWAADPQGTYAAMSHVLPSNQIFLLMLWKGDQP
jgi:C-terminal processing protease CtpA/Prc